MADLLLSDALALPAVEAAPLLLGARLTHATGQGTVTVRLTEVEAYMGGSDPGSHAFRGRSRRNEVMFGPAAHIYVYFTYGMHYCVNLVCGPVGTATAVLLRAGEVTAGHELAAARRRPGISVRELASGPANLAQALGITGADNGRAVSVGAEAADGSDRAAGGLLLAPSAVPQDSGPVLTGPRVGVSGPGGTADYPWRFWLSGEPTVSRYRAAAVRRTPA